MWGCAEKNDTKQDLYNYNRAPSTALGNASACIHVPSTPRAWPPKNLTASVNLWVLTSFAPNWRPWPLSPAVDDRPPSSSKICATHTHNKPKISPNWVFSYMLMAFGSYFTHTHWASNVYGHPRKADITLGGSGHDLDAHMTARISW